MSTVTNLDYDEVSTTYNHRAAWLGGIVLHGLAIVVIGVCGAIAVVLRDGDPTAAVVQGTSLDFWQTLGVVLLAMSAGGFMVSHAASQNRDLLPPWLLGPITSVAERLIRLPKAPEMAQRLNRTDHHETANRFVAIVGPFAFAVSTGIGTVLAVPVGDTFSATGVRLFLLGGAFAGFASALSGLMLERDNTRIQTASMFVCLIAATLATFDWWVHWVLVIAAGSLWIMLLSDAKEAIDRGVSWATFTMLGVAIAASATLAELENTLKSLASSGTQPRGFADLAPILEPWAAPARVEEAATTWRDFRVAAITTDPAGESSARVITAPADHLIRSLYVLIDSVGFAVAYSLLLLVATRFIIKRLDDSTRGRQLKSVLTVTRFAIPVILVLDIAENISGAAAVMTHMQTDPATAAIVGRADLLARIHVGAALMKWVSLAGAAFAVGAGAIFAARHRSVDPATSIGRAARLLRVNIVLVVVVMLALRNRQVYDAIRRFARGDSLAWEVIILVAIVIGTGLAIRYLAELLCHQTRASAEPDSEAGGESDTEPEGETDAAPAVLPATAPSMPAGDPQRRLRNGASAVAAALVLAVLLQAWGLIIPVGMWAVLELLSLPLGEQDEESARSLTWRDIRDAAALIAAIFLASLAMKWLFGNSGVRWLLVVFGAVEFGRALRDITTRDQVQSSLVGLRPLIRSWGGLKPLWKRGAPWVARSALAVVSWLRYSASRRLISPVMWLWARLNNVPEERQPKVVEPPRAEPATYTPGQRIAKLLGGLIPVFVGAAVVRAALGLALYDSANAGGFMLLLLGVALVLAGPVLYAVRPINPPTWTAKQGVAAVRLAAATIFMLYVAAWELVEVPHAIVASRAVGAIGVLCLAMVLFAVIGTAISYLTERSTPLRSLALVNFSKTPYFLLALVWVVIASMVDRGGYHNITVAEAAPGTTGARITAARLTTDWIEACAPASPTYPDADAAADPTEADSTDDGTTGTDGADEATDPVERPAVPMFFVAASGGGIRAAYWTASALELFDEKVAEAWTGSDRCNQPIFAASGASGGSLGLSVYAANHLVSPPGTKRVGDLLDEDFLAPTVGWFLFADLIRPFALWDYNGDATVDRARVLEVAWEEAWDDRPVRDDIEPRCPSDVLREAESRESISLASGLRETWCLGAPLLMLNGAEVNSACRFNTSVLDNNTRVLQDGRAKDVPPTPVNCLRPPSGVSQTTFSNGPLGATIDLIDYLCTDDDISLSTAALLSARFPFVSPSGRVDDRSDSCKKELERSDFDPAYVVDGGYIDNSGASSVVELWAEVSQIVNRHNSDPANVCIVPVFLQLDNGYDFDRITPPDRPNELLVPLSAAMNARGSREAEAKQVASNIFASPIFSRDQQALENGELVDRWIRLVPEAHPGVQAPLGWVLSSAASGDLDDELAKEDDEGFAQLGELLSPDLRCVTVDPPDPAG